MDITNFKFRKWQFSGFTRLSGLIAVILVCTSISAQDLLKSRRSSEHTFIYKISDKEAFKIVKNPDIKIDTTYFHSFVDEYPADSVYEKNLLPGHYLRVYSIENKQITEYAFVPAFDVFILNNNTDLCIQIYDLQGNRINNATVKINSKKLKFDVKTQCYTDKKSNKKGLLSVVYNGQTSYYQLERAYNNSAFRRGTRTVLYGTPVKYIWIPVAFTVYVPVDAVKSLKRGRAQGTIYQIKDFFSRTWEKITDKDYDTDDRYDGYLVFNKPKYLLNDTVKFKAFIINEKNGKSIDKPVEVRIDNRNGKSYILSELTPYRKGAYEYQFFLHDSLNLKLDAEYNLYLSEPDKRWNWYIYNHFRYEDYELSKIKLDVRASNGQHYKGVPFPVFAKATDENNLILPDARVKIRVYPLQNTYFFDDYTFLPDTLLTIEKNLQPVGETEILISDSLFPKANFDYGVHFELLTSDNRRFSTTKNYRYFYWQRAFELSLINDSIECVYRENGIRKTKNLSLLAIDNFGNKTGVFSGETPCVLPFNPFFRSYIVMESDSLSQKMDLSSQPSLLQCFSQRTGDSVFIEVQNPRKLHFSYNIYRKNNERAKGSGKELIYKEKTHSKQTFFISLRYVWGGEIKEETYSIPFYDKQLTIQVEQPALIYPGQTVNTEITVSDAKGCPVENVDLTAYSLTDKFSYTPPTLPSFSKKYPSKTLINNFKINDLKDKQFTTQLDYEYWKQLAHLDSVEYYKFLYPNNSIYRYIYKNEEKITQFSPFVVSEKGEILPVHVIYADNKPVYFSWSSMQQPYSFRINPGYHQIRLRLIDREIRIDSLYFPKDNKLIFSLKNDISCKNIRIMDRKNQLDDSEKSLLYPFIFPYRQNFGENIAYIQSGEFIQRLDKAADEELMYILGVNSQKDKRQYAGPVSGNIQFFYHKGSSMNFLHERFFEYDFSPNLIKMREINKKNYPVNLNSYGKIKPSLYDKATTMQSIENEWNEYLYNKRRANVRYHYPQNTQKGNGCLRVEMIYPDLNHTKPLNILLFRNDDSRFLRIYPGNTSIFHDLQEGNYHLIGFFPGKQYYFSDSILLKYNGLTYQKMRVPFELKKDSFSITVSDLIDKYLLNGNPNTNYTTDIEIETIYQNYQRQFTYEGEGEIISGYVYDLQDKEPLIGVSVTIKGTSYGTITDIDGKYSIKVPWNHPVLQFSYLGYVSKYLNINAIQTTAVGLEADHTALEEVVVIGYGSQKKSDLMGSVVSVNSISTTLQGRVAGISTVNSGQIRIRGISSAYAENNRTFPLLIEGISTEKEKAAGFDNAFLESASQSGSIRSKFSDYAYWQPKLTTDKDGKASFSAVFPDDITSWNTYVLAMNDKKQSGQTQGNIRSFKPWMAQLSVPRFLVEGDTTQIIGKSINYTSDTINVSTSFEIDGERVMQNRKTFADVLIDTLQVPALSDSMRVRYVMQKSDGFFDGEEREIPVFPQGLEETKGEFILLQKDTVFTKKFDNISGKIHFHAQANALDIIDNELNNLISYRYLCNEQLGSKLKALLAQKQIAEIQGIAFQNDKDIEKIIDMLAKRRNKDGWWGWWQNSETDYNFSFHVLTALLQAKQSGFKINMDADKIGEKAVVYLEQNPGIYQIIKLLKILRTLNVPVDYVEYTKRIPEKGLSFNAYLNLLELKQLNNIPISTDTLKYFKKETLFGSIYFNSPKEKFSPYDLENNISQNTLLAYRILKRENKISNDLILGKIRSYFMENKSASGWRNTYESSQIIETLLPDILGEKRQFKHSELSISGDVNQTLFTDTKKNSRLGFPLDTAFIANQGILIRKTGDEPVYLTFYQREWNKNPQEKQNDFIIKSAFNNGLQTLTAGQPVKLIVDLEVKKDADYVMINVPIPAGCSYNSKSQAYYSEIHREYFKHETAIFCQRLKIGHYQFEIDLLPRFTGVYHLNPAQAELMYFPTFNANEAIKTVKIGEIIPRI